MLYYILIGLVGFFVGGMLFYLVSKAINKSQKQDYLINELNEFKRSIDEFKKQTEINSIETKNAIETASKLTKILTTNQNLKGQFGEDCLESILKICFPNENINYLKQPNFVNEDENGIRPDFLVNLPNDKSILIDCKLNLEKYVEYKDNQDVELNDYKKAEFIKDLNNTINLLSNKKYQTAKGITQPDFVLMYIPLEPVITTIYTDSEFLSVIKNASIKNIIIVGNSSILTVIKLVKMLWAKDAQESNIENIIESASKIYELLAIHSNFLAEIRNNMQENMDRFNKEYEKMTTNSTLFKTAQKLQSFGINLKTKKDGKKLSEVTINSDFLNN